MNLVAKKAFRYHTRRLLPGDQFQAPDRYARRLILLKCAERILQRPVTPVAPPPPEVARAIEDAVSHPLDHDGDGRKGGAPKPAASEELTVLRAEYQAKMGKRPFPGWGRDELRRRMAAVED